MGLTGSGSSGLFSKVYKNVSGVFTDINADLPGVSSGSVSWGDYDNDGNLDILLAGYTSTESILKIYRNTNTLANVPPGAPTNLQSSAISINKISLSWNKATDTRTPQNTLTYNIRVGTTAGSSNIVGPMASLSNGFRRIPASGNAEFKNSGYAIDNLTPGITYYWSVQAIDQGFAGSLWAPESSFTLLVAPVAGTAGSVTQNSLTVKWSSSTGAAGYRVDIGTDPAFTTFLTGYNNVDAGNVTSLNVTGLTAKTTYYYRIRSYNSSGTSFNSNTISATTLQNPPTGLIASSCNNLVTLTWNAISDAGFMYYRIYGGTTDNPTAILDESITQISVTTKTLSGFQKDQTCYFRISAMISPGVESAISTSASVKVKTGVVPKIKAKWNDMLICYNTADSIVSYQWYKNSSAISSAIGQYYVTNKQPGPYYVQSTDKNGCKNNSNIITISNAKSVSVFPNPAKTSFTLSLNCEALGKTMIGIYNSSGIKVLEYQTEKLDIELNSEIPVSNIQTGIYTVEVTVNNEEITYSRIVIIK